MSNNKDGKQKPEQKKSGSGEAMPESGKPFTDAVNQAMSELPQQDLNEQRREGLLHRIQDYYAQHRIRVKVRRGRRYE